MLLDTHALVWLTLSPAELSSKAKEAIAEHQSLKHPLYISAASFWEISIKIAKCKINIGMAATDFYDLCLKADSLEILDTTPGHWIQTAQLDWPHKDPVDRLLVATAMALDLKIVTCDKEVTKFYGNCVW